MPARNTKILIIIFLIVATSLAYSRACRNKFVNYDDNTYAEANPHVQEGLTPSSLSWAFTTTHGANWHPLTWISLQFDSQLFGINPEGYHLTNVVLHILNSVLLCFLFWRMTEAVWPSALVAALFALHPLHVESVAWISERKDVLSSLFWILTTHSYLTYTRNRHLGWYLLTLLLFTFGLLSKPMLVTLPCVLLLLDYWPLGRFQWMTKTGKPAGSKEKPSSIAFLIVEKLPFFVLAFASSLVTIYAQSEKAIMSLDEAPISLRFANALVSYAAYLGNTLCPFNLSICYPFPWKGLPVWQGIVAFLLLACLTGLVLREMKRKPYLFVGWFWFLGTLVPVIGLVQVGLQARADRYTYLPLIGLFIIVAWGLQDIVKTAKLQRGIVASSVCVVLVVLALLTWLQTGYWYDGMTLWKHALEVTEDNYVAHDHLAELFQKKGDEEAAFAHYSEALRIRPGKVQTHLYVAQILCKKNHYDEAVPHYLAALRYGGPNPSIYTGLGIALMRLRRLDEAQDQLLTAMQLNPSSADTADCLGAVFVMKGLLDEAERYYSLAVQLDPNHVQAHNDLGLLLLDQLRPERAAEEFRLVLHHSSNNPEAHNSLGIALFFQGKWKEAIESYTRAVQLAPQIERYHFNLASAFQKNKQTEEAAKEYREGLKLDPNWPEKAARHAWECATSPNPQQRHVTRAILLAQQACEATAPKTPAFYLDAWAAAYAIAGLFEEASATARQALEQAEKDGKQEQAAQIRSRIDRYSQRQPYFQAALPGNPLGKSVH